VVRLIARGKVMKEVAADLGISVRTVAFHKYRTMRSLGLDSSAALVRYAVYNHML
jgi:DNA-binding NarL/FixJ family response regulator